MKSYWIVFRGAPFALERRETLIGRSSECHVVLPDPSVSRRHARICVSVQRELELEDLKSRFGTIVNGENVTGRRNVAPGDSIVLGRVAVQLVADLTDAEPWHAPQILYAEHEPMLTTNTDVTAAGHIRRLILRALERKRPLDQAWLIKNAIVAAAREWRATEPRDSGAAERLLSAADIIASWHEDGSLDAWRAELAQLLELGK